MNFSIGTNVSPVFAVAREAFAAVGGVGWTLGFWNVFAARAAFGVAQAGAYPVLNKMTRIWFPLSIRTSVQGLVTAMGRVNAIADVTRVALDVRSGTNAEIDVAESFAGQRMNHDKVIPRRLVHGMRSELDEL